MQKKIMLVKAISGAIMLGGMALAGCTDSNYDLSNLNKTIAFGNEDSFSLPGDNSTSEMVLDDVLEIEDNDVIKVAEDGSYYFSRSADEDGIEPAMPVVDEIPLTQVASATDYDYDLGEAMEIVDEARRQAPGLTSGSPTAQEIYSFQFNSLDEIADVMGLSLADLRAGINIDLNFSEDLKLNVDNIEWLMIDLPAFIDVDFKSKYEGDVFNFEKSTNTLTFEKLTENGVHLEATLNGIDFARGFVPDEHGYYLYFSQDSVAMKGGIWLDVKYEEQAAARYQAKAVKEDLRIHCHSSIDETIMLTGAKGKFSPEISLGKDGKPVGEFEINNLPDFLDDEDVHLSIDNPELRVWVNSNMDIRGIIKQASITATDAKGEKVVVEIDTENYPLMVDPNVGVDEDGYPVGETKTAIIITDKPYTGVKQSHTYYGVAKSGQKLGNLLYNIPKNVAFDCSVAADSTYEGTIKLGYKDAQTKEGWYKIQPTYEVFAPLTFNSDAVIVYRDSITGWHDDLEDITLSDGAEVILTAEVVNNLPLDLTFHAKAIEKTGENSWTEMSDRMVAVNITDQNDQDLKIKANATTKLKISLKQNVKEGFKRIDGIAFSASALGNDGSETLNSRTQNLRLNNIGVTLRGRIIVNLDD